MAENLRFLGEGSSAQGKSNFLEKAVKAEEVSTTKVRGDTQINPYELA